MKYETEVRRIGKSLFYSLISLIIRQLLLKIRKAMEKLPGRKRAFSQMFLLKVCFKCHTRIIEMIKLNENLILNFPYTADSEKKVGILCKRQNFKSLMWFKKFIILFGNILQFHSAILTLNKFRQSQTTLFNFIIHNYLDKQTRLG